MSYTVIIAEKPDAARKIAESLADGKPREFETNGVRYYKFTVNGKEHVCIPAVGHLFTLLPKGRGWTYPIFEFEWVPTYLRKESSWTEKYLRNFQDLSKNASELIGATDFDMEGEVILYNILKYIFKTKDAKRMKFSTLTKEELVDSYKNAYDHIIFPMVESGLTRHNLDALWGFNLTRALTLSLRNNGSKLFNILSTGRVQGPCLALIYEREQEIRNFKPIPYWQAKLILEINGKLYTANYEKEKLWKREEAEKLKESCKLTKEALVEDIKKRQYKQSPPAPFNTTDLQSEAFNQFKFSPRQTLDIAEELYQKGWISYPRSASQKLPRTINYEKILRAASTFSQYREFVEEILKKKTIKPVEGKKDDPAHPSVHITSEAPNLQELSPQQKKVYDLVARRTLAAFGDEAIRESTNVILNVNGNKFILSGKVTISPGWMKIYEPYLNVEEQLLPQIKVGDKLKIVKLEIEEKQTEPPSRYTQGSIIKELEARNLGTRCVAENTVIPVIVDNNFYEVSVKDLFESLNKNNLKGEEEVRYNSNKLSFSVYKNNLVTSKFYLVSRRKLEKNERMLEITFEDGSKVRLTEEHPVLIYENNKLIYVPAKQLSKGMRAVSSFLFYDKISKKIEWKNFVKLLDSKSKLYCYIDLKKWRVSKGLTQKELGKMLNVRQSVIAGWERKRLVPAYVWSKIDLPIPKTIYSTNKEIRLQNPFPLVVSSPLVRILAHLIGDGSLDRKKLRRENYFDFRYTNNDIDLIKLFINDIERIFKMNKKIRIKIDKRSKNKFYIRLPAVVGRILGTLFNGLVSKDVSVDKELYPDFIGALFDDEGHACKNETKIFISNSNLYIIKNIVKYLRALGFRPYVRKEPEKFRKKNWNDRYKVYLYGRNVAKFLEIVPFFHAKKKDRVIENLSRTYKYRNIPHLLSEKKVFSVLPEEGMELKKIVKTTGIPFNTVVTCIKNLRKNGYVGVRIKGISERPRKKILYFPLKECSKTFYSLLGEKVISPTLLTKTIKKVKEIKYNGYVYDITNPITSNFVLKNGVVVHNSTRAEVLQTLYDRHYIEGKSIKITPLGEAVVKVLKEFSPSILSEELTRHFEQEMDLVFNGRKTKEEVIEEAKQVLTPILSNFKANQEKVGIALSSALKNFLDDENTLGECPSCKSGKLVIRKNKNGNRFVGCSNYPSCKVTYPLPHASKIVKTGKVCKLCGTPIVKVIRKGKRTFEMCLDPNCPSKKEWASNKNNVSFHAKQNSSKSE
jgi:DNA topoisomerase-1